MASVHSRSENGSGLEAQSSGEGSHKSRVHWHHARLIIQDAMKLPTIKPVFPDPASLDTAFSEGITTYPEGAANPSLHRIDVKLSGLVNKLSRSGLWRMLYCVLSDSAFTFFSAASGELTGKVEYSIPLQSIAAVEDGPDEVPKSISAPQPGSVMLRLFGKDQKVVVAFYDKKAQEVWRAALEEAVKSNGAYTAKGQNQEESSLEASRLSENAGLHVVCVSTAPSAKPKGCVSGNPAFGNTIVRMAPAWGDSMSCALAPGSHVRIWMTNELVCCISPEGRQLWCDSRTMAPAEQPGYKLDYKMEGVSVSDSINPSDPRKALQMQMASYGLLVLVLNAILWGFISAATGYWCSLAVLAGALAAGFLPGPPPPPQSDGSPPGCVPVRLQLHGCVPDVSTQTGAALKRTMTLAAAKDGAVRVDGDGPAGKVDESDLLLLQKQYPDENKCKLARFLLSRKHVLQDAIDMLEGERQLRASLGPLDPVVVLPFLTAGLLHFEGYALDGTPLLVVKVKNLNKDADSKAMQKMILIVCDLMNGLAPEKQCMTVLGDLEGFSISNNVDFNKLKDCINILKACLPEVLCRVFVLNAPYVFQAVWGFVKALLDPSTVDKVRILGKKEWPLVTQFIDASVLSKVYGGDNEYVYDSSANGPDALNWGPVDVPPSLFQK